MPRAKKKKKGFWGRLADKIPWGRVAKAGVVIGAGVADITVKNPENREHAKDAKAIADKAIEIFDREDK